VAPPRVLLVPFECLGWQAARGWSYVGHYAIEEGLRAHGADVTVLPAWVGVSSSDPSSWLRFARDLVGGQPFDQVWLWLVHAEFTPDFLDWIASLAPVRVGVLWESLEYSERECDLSEQLRERKRQTMAQMAPLTHVLAVDERDVDELTARGLPAFWLHNAIPARLIAESINPAPIPRTAFYGQVYGDRARYLRRAEMEGLVVRPQPSESTSVAPNYFDALHFKTSRLLRRTSSVRPADLGAVVGAMREIRRHIFEEWLLALANWGSILNLPSLVKCYTSRVEEAMAAGAVVISYDIDDRPRNRALFEDGEEILLYRRDDPDAMLEHVRRLARDPAAGRAIAARALAKVRARHTMEQRVAQVLAWIDTGEGHDAVSRGTHPRPQPVPYWLGERLAAHGAVGAGDPDERGLRDAVASLLNGSRFAFTKTERGYIEQPHHYGRFFQTFVLQEIRERRATPHGDRPLFVWGAGSRGRAIGQFLVENDCVFSGFVDSDPLKQGGSLLGQPVLAPATLQQDQGARDDPARRPYVVIGSMFVRPISVRLEAMGFEDEQDYCAM
jgi:hypothetical protein